MTASINGFPTRGKQLTEAATLRLPLQMPFYRGGRLAASVNA